MILELRVNADNDYGHACEIGKCRFEILQSDNFFGGSTNRMEQLGVSIAQEMCEGWNFNSGNYLFTTDTK